LALGHFKLGNYNDARKFNEALLEYEPNNHQAHALRQEIEDRVAKGKTPPRILFSGPTTPSCRITSRLICFCYQYVLI
jgi:hypothetical protein